MEGASEAEDESLGGADALGWPYHSATLAIRSPMVTKI